MRKIQRPWQMYVKDAVSVLCVFFEPNKNGLHCEERR